MQNTNTTDWAVSIAMSDGYLDELEAMADDGDEDSQMTLKAIRRCRSNRRKPVTP